MNHAYKSLFASRIAGAIGTATAARAVAHAGDKGRIREILIRDLFRPLLPADIGVGTGHVVTSNDKQSPEQDVIIYDRRILPPVMFETLGLVPLESVLATVEVKSTLNNTELQKAYNNAKIIDCYPYLHGKRDEKTKQQVSHDVQRVITAVFALDSDLAAGRMTELDRYQALHPSGDSPIKQICVCGRGYWFFDNPKWSFVEPDQTYREVLCFIVGLIDKFADLIRSRETPGLAGYVVTASEITRG